jgi:hypothetical protein
VAIERTVTMDVVVRDAAEEALEAWRPIEHIHGLAGRIGSDGTTRGLTAGGSPRQVADVVRGYQEIGIAEVTWTFRSPFDVETMRRLPEVRAALAG